jgi:D-galactose 1-dehydrogenase
MKQLKVAIVGMGKIARDQHLPAIAANSELQLAAVASPHHRLAGVPNFATLEVLLREIPDIDAVVICTSPQVRYDIAWHALNHRKHVMLEKPPGATLSEVQALVDLAERQNVALFAAWHARAAAAVEAARGWLTTRTLRRIKVTWKEDVRVWHPGQAWIWQAGGLGVFDPGINALSILTYIVPGTIVLREAKLSFPSNCETPIAAELLLNDAYGAPIHVDLDFLQTGPQTWEIAVETDDGRMLLSRGGSAMYVDGNSVIEAPSREYPELYAHFLTLVRERRIDVDTAPLRLVADAFLNGQRTTVQPVLA